MTRAWLWLRVWLAVKLLRVPVGGSAYNQAELAALDCKEFIWWKVLRTERDLEWNLNPFW